MFFGLELTPKALGAAMAHSSDRWKSFWTELKDLCAILTQLHLEQQSKSKQNPAAAFAEIEPVKAKFNDEVYRLLTNGTDVISKLPAAEQVDVERWRQHIVSHRVAMGNPGDFEGHVRRGLTFDPAWVAMVRHYAQSDPPDRVVLEASASQTSTKSQQTAKAVEAGLAVTQGILSLLATSPVTPVPHILVALKITLAEASRALRVLQESRMVDLKMDKDTEVVEPTEYGRQVIQGLR